MSDFPYDVWLYIFDFLPSDFIPSMLCVNRACYEIIMDWRYRSVNLALDRETLHLLTRLRDPLIARRVRSLHIQPYFNNAFLRAWILKHNSRSCRSRLIKSVKRVIGIPTIPWHLEKLKFDLDGSKLAASFDDLTKSVVATFPILCSVSEFLISSDCPCPPDCNLRFYFDACWKAFSARLCRFSLTCDSRGFFNILTCEPPFFPRLQHLEVTFSAHNRPSDQLFENDVINNVLLPFVNQHKSVLTTFCLSSTSTIDFSDFFLRLGPFAALKRVSLSLTFDFAFRSNRAGLTRFLRDQGHTLQHVDLNISQVNYSDYRIWCIRNGLRPEPPTELFFGTWLAQNAADNILLSNLMTLNLPNPNSIGLGLLPTYIQRSTDTLTELAIGGPYLLYEEVYRLVSMFEHRPAATRLRTLCINVYSVSGVLLGMLASKLPGLHSLCLWSGGCRFEQLAKMEYSNLVWFATRTPAFMFPRWDLYDVGIWYGFYPSREVKFDNEIMILLAGCIPTIRSFWGQGNMTCDISSRE